MQAKYVATLILAMSVSLAWGQMNVPENWFHLGPQEGYPGLNTISLYQDLLKEKEGETVVVAVIDSGIDYLHEDLDEVMWVNEDEIPDNGIDDDNNGYVDDIHGWNFLGGTDGKNVDYETLEVTRLYRRYSDMFEDADPETLSKKERQMYDRWLVYKEEVDSHRTEENEQNAAFYGGLLQAMKSLKQEIGKEEVTMEDLQSFESDNQMLVQAAKAAASLLPQMGSYEALLSDLEGAYDYFYGQYHYHYNPDFNPRSIVGDDPEDLDQRRYGNNDYEGPDARHGTHVAGIIGAERNNDIGIRGVANNVRIMTVRAVPDGDERDKDVLNAIYYAVDNGAAIVNMSFGKGYSPSKVAVDKAVKYARKHDVLLVHAAGNDGSENDNFNNYPNDRYMKKGLFGPRYADNWIEVGAVDWHGGDKMAASFSNYSSENVDVFAPGLDIYSTVPDDQYESLPGTSMAAPMVSGVAALLRSYFPDLTAEQVKNIILSSVRKHDERVTLPGSDDKIAFSRLALSGGVVDAKKAVELALETRGKNRKAGRYLGPYTKAPKGSKKESGEQARP